MASKGTFVLADIGGYTQFLTGVGIEHGKEITGHPLNSLLKCNRGRWKVANVEGDCLFFYREGREPDDEILDHLRALYQDFCERTSDIAARSTCDCGACSRTSELSLKFIAHAGEYDTHKVGRREELIGPDVVVAHRLLKNSVSLPEYALLSGDNRRLDSATGLPVSEGRDHYEDVGEVRYTIVDLEPVRREFEERRQFYLTEADAKLKVFAEIDAPTEMVWDAEMDLEKRRRWQVTIENMDHVSGQVGKVGEVHRCVHSDGSKMIHLTVGIDNEGRRKTEKIWLSRLLKDCYITIGAEPIGTERCRASLLATFQPAIPVISHVALPLIMALMKRSVQKDMAGLKALCEDAVRQNRAADGS